MVISILFATFAPKKSRHSVKMRKKGEKEMKDVNNISTSINQLKQRLEKQSMLQKEIGKSLEKCINPKYCVYRMATTQMQYTCVHPNINGRAVCDGKCIGLYSSVTHKKCPFYKCQQAPRPLYKRILGALRGIVKITVK